MTVSKRQSGFTLIELLVVVSVIVLLVAILIPALSRARDQARVVKCVTNYKALVTGEFVYAAENQGKGTSYCLDAGTGYSWNFWTNILYYTKTVTNGKVFVCPDVLLANTSVVTNLAGKYYDPGAIPFRSVSINQYIAGTRTSTSAAKAIPFSSIKNQSVIAYIGERPNAYPLDANYNQGQQSFTDGGGLSANHLSMNTGATFKGWGGFYYPVVEATTNVAFADGHAESVKGTFSATYTFKSTVLFDPTAD